MKFWYIYGRKFTKYLHGTQSLLNILKISGIKKSIILTHTVYLNTYNVICHHWISPLHIRLSETVWFSSATKSDLRRLHRIVRTAERIIDTTLPTLQELYSSRVSERAVKITLDPHIQHTPSLNCCRLVDATEHWAPERPDTETVSFLGQSISWTLEIKHGTHNTIIHCLFTIYTYFFISSLHIPDLYTHCLYCILCFCYFVHCLFVYCSFVVCVLSCHCHSVALWSFCH